MTDPIRPKELFWATQPTDSPYWHSLEEEEYHFVADQDYIVTNEQYGPYRQRQICKIIQTFWIRPQWMDDYDYRDIVRRGVESLFNVELPEELLTAASGRRS